MYKKSLSLIKNETATIIPSNWLEDKQNPIRIQRKFQSLLNCAIIFIVVFLKLFLFSSTFDRFSYLKNEEWMEITFFTTSVNFIDHKLSRFYVTWVVYMVVKIQLSAIETRVTFDT